MSVDRIEIYTQPDHHQKRHSSVEESVREKLEDLIEKHPISEEEEEEEETAVEDDSQNSEKEKLKSAALEDIKRSNYTVHPEQTPTSSDSESESETEEVDIDGFEIPQGKIPLDSQFSTDELKVLLQLAQNEGILKEDVDMKILEHGELGDRIRIADHKITENSLNGKENENENKKDESESKQASN
ncbi:uncharacterized protein KGF55_004638 [Candida pseudojiufengensis]|uniref:uncharacterized protein n=1 Tax=Candida pseudojiufengensis TaxID=497109 RepID=UPI00222506B5|nr:uncharacterized protein KGF55_004638 [Candida pseudojiufengensis]KAI5960346.1 hypothetical protein KGF55_004638 [Candida pseudojiufengensis]